MNKDEFNRIFDHNMDLASNEFWTQEKVQERIDHFSDENGKLDMNRFGAFLADQSRKYTEKFTYNLLFDLFVDDVPNDSQKDSESI